MLNNEYVALAADSALGDSVITIREADPTDGATLAAIYVASAGPTYRPFMPAAVTDRFTLETQRSHWNDKLSRAGYRYFVGEIAGEPKGFIGIGPATQQSHMGEVHSLFVEPDAARRGLGRALLRAGERGLAATGYQQAVLWVFSANHAARRFYERVGWKPVPGTDRWDPELLNKGIKISDCRYQQSLIAPVTEQFLSAREMAPACV